MPERASLHGTSHHPQSRNSGRAFAPSPERSYWLKGSKKASGVEEISIPGERAAKERRMREREGIPVDLPTWRQLGDIMDELGVKAKGIPK